MLVYCQFSHLFARAVDIDASVANCRRRCNFAWKGKRFRPVLQVQVQVFAGSVLAGYCFSLTSATDCSRYPNDCSRSNVLIICIAIKTLASHLSLTSTGCLIFEWMKLNWIPCSSVPAIRKGVLRSSFLFHLYLCHILGTSDNMFIGCTGLKPVFQVFFPFATLFGWRLKTKQFTRYAEFDQKTVFKETELITHRLLLSWSW